MKLNISQFFALLISIGVLMLFIFRSEKEYLPPKKVVNEYDKVLIKNKKSNKITMLLIDNLTFKHILKSKSVLL